MYQLCLYFKWVLYGISKIPYFLHKIIHGTSNHLNCLQLVLCMADRECWRGWMRALVINIDKLLMLLSRIDVNLSIWDRNFQNNNWFHLEISITIRGLFGNYWDGIGFLIFSQRTCFIIGKSNKWPLIIQSN